MRGAGLFATRRAQVAPRWPKPVGHWAKTEEISLEPRFAELLPPAAEETRRLTEEAFFRDGCPEPLIVWRRHDRKILLVGYDVFPLLKLYRVPFRIIEREFPDLLAAELFVVQFELGKNRLTPLQASYLRGLRYDGEKLEHGGDRRSLEAQEASSLRQDGMLKTVASSSNGGQMADVAGAEGNSKYQNDDLKMPGTAGAGSNGAFKTASALAEIFHVSAPTIHRDGALAAAVKQIAGNCGGRDARDLLLKPGMRLTHGRILAWAELPAWEQKSRLLHLRLRGKCTRAKRNTEEPLTITLPRRSPALAQGIFDRLGPARAARVRDDLNKLLNGTALERRNLRAKSHQELKSI